MEIHPSAIIHPKTKMADDVKIGPYAIIGAEVAVGAGCEIGAHCVIEGHTTLGRDCRIFSGAVIGSAPQDLKYKGEISYLEIGDNNVIREFVTINPATEDGEKTKIGNNNLLMAYSHVAHNCLIGNNVIIANGGTLAGYVTIEDRAVIGGLVAIHQFTRVGKMSIIGGCSKVVQDIIPYSMCDGHPTRVYGLNIVGLKRANISPSVKSDLKKAFKLLFKSKISIPSALKKIEKEIDMSDEISYLIKFIKSSKRGISV